MLFVLYLTIGQYIENNLTLNKLATEIGIPKDAKIGYTLGKRRGIKRNKRYYITFNIGEEEYRVRNMSKLNPHEVFNKINCKKEIKLWHRSRFQQIMGMGLKNEVYQLSLGDSILLSITDVKKKHSVFLNWLYPSIFLLFFGLWIFAFYKYKTLSN